VPISSLGKLTGVVSRIRFLSFSGKSEAYIVLIVPPMQ
jgi:hypothetical protein